MQSLVLKFMLLAMICSASCRAPVPRAAGSGADPGVDTIPGQLRKSLKVVEYTSGALRKILYSGHDDDVKDLDPDDRKDRSSINSIYSVDAQSDIVISFNEKDLEDIGGNISVRARLQRNPPVELPVQNFTVVSEKELKKETVLILNPAKSLFGDDKYNVEFQSSLVNAESALAMLEHLLDASLSRNRAQSQMLSRSASTQGVEDAELSAQVARLVEQAEQLRKNGYEALRGLAKKIDELFLKADFFKDLPPDDLSRVQQIVRASMSKVDSLSLGLSADYVSISDSLKSCLAPKRQAYTIGTQGADLYSSVKVDEDSQANKGQKREKGLEQGQVILAIEVGKWLQIVYPSDFSGQYVEAKQVSKSLALLSETIKQCRSFVEKKLEERFAEHREGIARAKAAFAYCKGKTCDSLHGQIGEIQRIVRDRISQDLKRRISDARVHLRDAQLVHGDFVNIIVTVTVPRIQSLKLDSGSPTELTTIEERFTLRVIERGWSYSTRPQFALVKRLSDVTMGTSKDSPSNFKPAPGVLLNFRYKRNPYWTEWAIPSVGIAAFAVDFDPAKTFELGVGPSIGLLNDFVHLGAGINVSYDGALYRRSYYFISLDFLKTFDTFSVLFGGGGK